MDTIVHDAATNTVRNFIGKGVSVTPDGEVLILDDTKGVVETYKEGEWSRIDILSDQESRQQQVELFGVSDLQVMPKHEKSTLTQWAKESGFERAITLRIRGGMIIGMERYYRNSAATEDVLVDPPVPVHPLIAAWMQGE